VSATPPSVPAPRNASTGKVLFWGVVILIGLGAAVALLLVGRSTSSSSNSATPPAADRPAATWPAGKLRAPAISLVDQNGAPLSLAALRGRPVVVTFIDPLCRDYCPLEARHLGDAVRSLPAGSRPAIVAVSVNVDGNAHRYLAQDAVKWKLPPQWRWGIGNEPQLSKVWTRYHIGVLPQTKKVAGVRVRSIVHTEAAYVIDAAGYQRAIFLWPYSAAAITQTLRSLSAS
jgi:cytochrome oxidase Cu insertion factor (SCO1/SenC/PrrC family)